MARSHSPSPPMATAWSGDAEKWRKVEAQRGGKELGLRMSEWSLLDQLGQCALRRSSPGVPRRRIFFERPAPKLSKSASRALTDGV